MHNQKNYPQFGSKRCNQQLLATAISLSLLAPLAQAQLEEIVVTAQKRQESLQDVPISMQAFTGDQMSDMGIEKASDITKLAPNLNIATQNAMSQQIVIRGVGTNDFFGNAPGSVGLYMDEVTMSSPFLGGLGLYDMARVEVLRGPQNSLFGRNTTGGAINYISVMPEVGGEVEGYIKATYGSHDRRELEGAVSLPMGESAALRVAGTTYDRDGLWNNIDDGDDEYGDMSRESLRATLLWEPTDNTTVTLNFHRARQDGESLPTRAVGALTNDGALRATDITLTDQMVDFERNYATVNASGVNPSTDDWHDVRKTGANRADIEVDGGYLKVQHEFGDYTFTSITSYDDVQTYYSEDDGLTGNVTARALSAAAGNGDTFETLMIDMDQQYRQLSQELRLASSPDEDFRWIAGFYYFKEDSTLSQNIRFGANGVLAFHPALNPATGVPISAIDAIPNPYANTVSFSVAELENEVISPYVHTEFDLSDKLTMTFGLRYTEDTKKNPSYFGGAYDKSGLDPATFYSRELIETLATSLPVCPEIGPTQPPFTMCASDVTTREDLEFREYGGKLGVDYQLNNDTLLFASYSRGFKSGKYDIEFLHTRSTPFPDDPVDVETLDAFELGIKSDLLDNSLQLNAALFYSIWQDQQVFNVGSSGPQFLNLPESDIMGLELEVKWAPSETWYIQGGLGLIQSEIQDATGIDVAEEGHELPLTPEVTANMLISKEFDLTTGVVTLQTDFRYQSESKVKMEDNPPVDEYDSRFEINARASYTFGESEQYKVGLYIDNITEEQYCLQKENLDAITGTYYCMPNEGERTYRLQVGMEF